MDKDEVIQKLNSRVKSEILVCPFNKLIPFQKNLVELHDVDAAKLKESIKTAWIDPFKVWVAPDGEINILDGHQRHKVLKKGKYTGDVQCVQIERKDKQEAARFVLLFRSVYGKMTDEGLYEFIETFELDYNDLKPTIDLQDFNMGTFEMSYYKDITPDVPEDERTGMPEFQQEDQAAHRTIYIHFRNDEDIRDFAKIIKQKITDKTKYLWHPIQIPESTVDKRYEDRME